MVLRESKSQTNTLDVWPLDFLSDEQRRELILDALREAVKQIKATLKETK
jgi:DNA replication protein DnaD